MRRVQRVNVIDGASQKARPRSRALDRVTQGEEGDKANGKPGLEKMGMECLLFATVAALVCAYCVTAAEVKFDCGEADALCLTAFSALAAVVG